MIGRNRKNKVHEMIMNQIKDVEACLIHYEGFMCAATTPETVFETLQSLAGRVGQMEGSADVSLRHMIDSLEGATLLPSTRQDLINIATSCDSIANKCEWSANSVVFQRFRFPAEFSKDLMEIVSITREQFDLLKLAISRMFSHLNELLKDHSVLDDVREHESRVDKLEQAMYKKIFQMDIGLAERTQIANMVEYVCNISDVIENIADKIQIMLITRKA